MAWGWLVVWPAEPEPSQASSNILLGLICVFLVVLGWSMLGSHPWPRPDLALRSSPELLSHHLECLKLRMTPCLGSLVGPRSLLHSSPPEVLKPRRPFFGRVDGEVALRTL